VRRIKTSTAINDYVLFPHCGQVFVIDRERLVLKTGKCTRETVYGITSLSPEQAPPAALLSYVRMHWSIENRSHYVRDWNYDEDRSQVRTQKGPHMLSCLRNVATGVLRLSGVDCIAKALRDNAANPMNALVLIGA